MKIKSLLAVLVIVLIAGRRLSQLEYQHAISWDTFGYYLYLPAFFYEHDLTLADNKWADNMRKKYDLSGTLYQIHHLENGNFVIQYSCGMAVMMTPAFIVGHYAAQALGYPMNGFSAPYQMSVWIWSFIVAVIGLFALRRLLLLFFEDARVMWLLLLTAFATNYFILTTQAVSTSHIYLFTLYSFFIYHVVLWHRTKKWKHLIWLASSLGLMSLTRPTEFIAILIFLFWSFEGFRNQIIYWKETIRNYKAQFFAFIAIVALFAMPQILYFYAISGKPFIMSYSNPGEGFDFLYPHTLDYLFSFRKGLFIYTPILLFSFLALIFLRKTNRREFWTWLIFLVVYMYVVSSWSCWWYAHCFGQRSIYQVLPVFILLLGYFMQWMNEKQWSRIVGSVVLGLCLALSVFQSYQYSQGIIHGSQMTRAYYWAVFGKLDPDESLKELLLVDRPTTEEWPFVNKEKYTSKLIYDFRMEELAKVKVELLVDSSAVEVQELNLEKPYSEGWQMQWSKISKKDHNWFHVEAEFYAPADFVVGDLCLVTCADHKGGPYGYKAPSIHPDSLRLEAWNSISYDYLSPEIRVGSDNISSYLWYRGQSKAYMRQLKVTQFEPIR